MCCRFFILSLIFYVTTLLPHDIQQRVFDGHIAATYSVSFHVQLLNNKFGTVCAGAAMSPYCIVTAHCVVKKVDLEPILLHAKIGSILRERGMSFTVIKTIVHDFYYDDWTMETESYNDIALIFVKKRIPPYNIIRLESRAERTGEKGTLTGFGEYKGLDRFSRLPATLQEAKFTVLTGKIDTMPTAFTTSGRGGAGDSGVPFVWKEGRNPVLGAIYVSETGFNNNSTVRAVFIHIIDFKEWLNFQIFKAQRQKEL